jgi:predicted O-linked N-acetylglucosamine transferase (SPINDLY family)
MEGIEIARIIAQDKMDILVDLSGQTGANRLDIFTYRPAPVQITWLGYPNTVGLQEIQYRFTDVLADPLDTTQEFSENLVRLAGTQ